MVPAFFLDGWFNPFTMAEVGVIVACAALAVAALAVFAHRRVAESCRKCRFDLRGADHRTCPECGTSLAAANSRATIAWAPRKKLLASNLALAGAAALFAFFPGPMVRTLKNGAANGLSDRELVERTLGIDGNETLAYHNERTAEIAKGLRNPDGSIADFAALCEAIDRASLAARDDVLALELLPADRAGFFALETSHHLVADRAALARQVVAEVLEPTKLATDTADARRRQAMRASVIGDTGVRLALISNADFLSRSKVVSPARRRSGGRTADPSRHFLISGNPEFTTSGIDQQLAIHVRAVLLRSADGAIRAVQFREDPTQNPSRRIVEIDPPKGVAVGTLIFTIEVVAMQPGMQQIDAPEHPLARCVTDLELPYTVPRSSSSGANKTRPDGA